MKYCMEYTMEYSSVQFLDGPKISMELAALFCNPVLLEEQDVPASRGMEKRRRKHFSERLPKRICMICARYSSYKGRI
jgi:hypothetical protein